MLTLRNVLLTIFDVPWDTRDLARLALNETAQSARVSLNSTT